MRARYCFSFSDVPSPWAGYAYFDTADHMADVLFDHYHVPVKYEREFVNPVNPYRLVICKVLPWHRDNFLKALGELPNKMNLLGFNDYQQFCRDYLDYSEHWMMEKRLTA